MIWLLCDTICTIVYLYHIDYLHTTMYYGIPYVMKKRFLQCIELHAPFVPMFLCIDEVFEGYWCTSIVFNGRVFPKANCGSYGHVWDKSGGG